MIPLPLRDRTEAAQELALALSKYRGSNPLVVAIPRGGVPMGKIIADALGGELDVVLVRKLGAPGHPEYAIGSVDERGVIVLNEHAGLAGADEAYARRVARVELELIAQRRARYSPGQSAIAIGGRTLIVVDDGLATGSTMIAALVALREQQPAQLVCAVPVAAKDSLAQVARFADEVVCLATPEPFRAVSLFYEDFAPVSDEEVIALLSDRNGPSNWSHVEFGDATERSVRISADRLALPGDLSAPASPRGLVIFAHGSGSSRLSARNRFVAQVLNHRGYATLLFDLLTPEEDRSPASRFDISLLARRLDEALAWSQREPETMSLPVGLFGASTGAAAAIIVAAARPDEVGAVVSRGGRPDLAGERALAAIRRPTLLIVGGNDLQVLELNRGAQREMNRHAQLEIVPGATHLFEEGNTLEHAANLAVEWFERWLPAPPMRAGLPTAATARSQSRHH